MKNFGVISESYSGQDNDKDLMTAIKSKYSDRYKASGLVSLVNINKEFQLLSAYLYIYCIVMRYFEFFCVSLNCRLNS